MDNYLKNTSTDDSLYISKQKINECKKEIINFEIKVIQKLFLLIKIH